MWPAGVNVLGPDEKQDLKDEAEDLIGNADQWWDQPNELLAGRTPKECAEDDPGSLRDLFRSIRYIGVS